jgi:hypothetical protein
MRDHKNAKCWGVITYDKENYTHKGKGHLNHQNLYSVIIKDKITSTYPNVETILQLFLSLVVTKCS